MKSSTESDMFGDLALKFEGVLMVAAGPWRSSSSVCDLQTPGFRDEGFVELGHCDLLISIQGFTFKYV